MRKIRIATVTLLVFGKIKVFVMVDSYNHICKFHIDYVGDLDEDKKSEIIDKVVDFASKLCPSDMFGIEFSEAPKEDVFNYLPSKFV